MGPGRPRESDAGDGLDGTPRDSNRPLGLSDIRFAPPHITAQGGGLPPGKSARFWVWGERWPGALNGSVGGSFSSQAGGIARLSLQVSHDMTSIAAGLENPMACYRIDFGPPARNRRKIGKKGRKSRFWALPQK